MSLKHEYEGGYFENIRPTYANEGGYIGYMTKKEANIAQ